MKKKILSMVGYFLLLFVSIDISISIYYLLKWYFYTKHSEILEGLVAFLPFGLALFIIACSISFFFAWLLNKKKIINIKDKFLFWIMYGTSIIFFILLDFLWNFPIQRSWLWNNAFISLFLNLTIFYFLAIEAYLWVVAHLKRRT